MFLYCSKYRAFNLGVILLHYLPFLLGFVSHVLNLPFVRTSCQHQLVCLLILIGLNKTHVLIDTNFEVYKRIRCGLSYPDTILFMFQSDCTGIPEYLDKIWTQIWFIRVHSTYLNDRRLLVCRYGSILRHNVGLSWVNPTEFADIDY